MKVRRRLAWLLTIIMLINHVTPTLAAVIPAVSRTSGMYVSTNSNADYATDSDADYEPDWDDEISMGSNAEISTDSNAEISTDSNAEISTDSNAEISTDSNAEIATDSNAEGYVRIPDENLLEALLDNGVDSDEDERISYEELLELQYFYAWDYQIQNLEGLQYAENLQVFEAPYNEIRDISELAGLTKLYHIVVPYNNLTNIPDLKELKELLLYSDDAHYEPISMFEGNYIERENFYGKFNEELTEEWLELNSYIPEEIASDSNAEYIEFVDPRLVEALLDNGVDANDDGHIDYFELSEVTSLNLWGYGISTLEGLEYAENLTDLNLEDNFIEDLTPLQDLTNITWLVLRNNQIEDITPLSGLTMLEYCDLSYNQITDLLPLADCVNIWGLYVGHNNLSSLDGIENMTNMQYFDAWGNEIEDIAPVAEMVELYSCNLSENKITDLTPLTNCESLRYLEVGYNCLEDIPDMRNLTELMLYDEDPSVGAGPQRDGSPMFIFGGNYIPRENFEDKFNEELTWEWLNLNAYTVIEFADENLAQIMANYDTNGDGELTTAEVGHIYTLSISGCEIKNLSGLEYLFNLEELDISDNIITSLTPISNMQFLVYLDARNNKLKKIPDLCSLVNLRLYNDDEEQEPRNIFGGNLIKRTRFTDKLPVVPTEEWLDLNSYDNTVIDVPDIHLLKALIDYGYDVDGDGEICISEARWADCLDAQNYGIIQLWGLEYFENLEHLNLSNNKISNLEPLSQLDSLLSLEVRNNKLESVADLTSNADLVLQDVASDSNAMGIVVTPRNMFGGNRIPREEFDGKLAHDISEEWLDLNSYDDTPVTIKDKKFRMKLIALGYDTDEDGKLCVSEMRQITNLDIHDSGVSNLSGIEAAIYLTDLNASGCEIVDLTPLASLKRLSVCNLDGNKITDLTPLQDCVSLKTLTVRNNKLTTVPDFTGLKKLEVEVEYWTYDDNGDWFLVRSPEDMFSGNKIYREEFTDKFCIELTEEWLDLNSYDDSVVYIPDAVLKTELLEWCDTQGDGELSRTEMKKLYYLSLEGMGVEDLTGLEYAVNLIYLNISNNKVKDITPIASLTELEDLVANNNRLTTIPDLSNLTYLEVCGDDYVTVMFAGNRILRKEFSGKFWCELTEEWLALNSFGHIDTISNGAWAVEDGIFRCYDENGNLYRNKFIWSGEKLFYVDAYGDMIKSRWVNYLEDGEEVWRYLDKDGAVIMSREFDLQSIDGHKFAFDKDGFMMTGWVISSENRMVEGGIEWKKADYYFEPDGVAASGWKRISVYGGWNSPNAKEEYFFFFNPNTHRKATGFVEDRSGKYYLDMTGAMLFDMVVEDGCHIYEIDGEGVIQTERWNHTEVTLAAVEPTCTETGLTEGKYCSECRLVLIEQEVVKALGHTEVIDEAVAPTCTETGLTEGKHCSVCNDEIVAQEVVKELGHTVVIDKEVTVTCVTDGLTEGEHCSVCGEILKAQEIIAARGWHDYYKGSCKDCGEDAPIVAPKLKISGEANSGKPKLSWDAVEDEAVYNVERSLKKSSGYELLKEGVEDTVYVDDSAVAGTLYYYRISAVNEDGIESKYSNTPSRTCDLATPEITVENIASSGKIKISWNAVEGAAKYEVYRAETEDGTFTRLSTTTKTSLTNSKDMEAGDTYYYKVRAVHDNSNANSAYSEIISKTCILAQPKVKASNVASSGKIQLTWDKVEGAKKYEVYRSVGDNESYERFGSTTSTKYTNTSVTAGVTYYYKVIALHADEEANSAYSAEVSRLCKLGYPTVTAGTEAVTGKPEISWKEITGAVEYEVYRSAEEGDAGTLLGKTHETSYKDADEGIKAGEVYYYTVKAVHENAGANSAVSTAVPVTCALEQPTVTVSNNASNGTLKLSWNKVTGVAKYEVYRAVGEDGTYKLLKTTTSRSLSNTSVTPGETYYYKVIAVHTNTEANSAESAVVSGICKLARPSVTVSNNESTGKIKISWEAVEGAAKYEVYRAETADAADEEYTLLKAVTGTSLTNSSVETGKTYYYKVVAVHENEDANSTDSAVVSGICKLARPSVKVSNDAVTGKPVIRWSSVDGAVAYDVYGSTSKNSGFEELGRVDAMEFTEEAVVFMDEMAEAGVTYYYKVAAVHADEAVNSAFSSVKNRTCDLAQPVIELENDSSTGKIRVRWEKLDGAEEYEIYRADSEDGKYRRLSTVSGTTSSYVDTKAEPGSVYYYKVCANHEKSAADSVDSEVAAAICILARPSVTVSNVSSTGKIKVSWKAVEGAEGYVVLRADSKDGEYEVLKETTGTSLTNTSVETGKTYYYKVIAVHSNWEADSYESTVKSGTCKLAAPTVSITTKDGKPRLTWKKVTGAVKYEVYRATSKDGSYSLIKTTTGTSLTNTSATKGKTYYYKVKAIYSNTKANSAYSSVKSIKATK